MDQFLNKIPGSLGLKVAVATTLVIGALAYPVFGNKNKNRKDRQGHDLLSSEKPEGIRAGQEQARKLYRQQRDRSNSAASASALEPSSSPSSSHTK